MRDAIYLEHMTIRTATFAERPDLVPAIWTSAFRSSWPGFIAGDLIAEVYYESFFLGQERAPFAEYALLAFDEEQPDVPLARAFSVPFAFGETSGRTVLPEGGWDELVCWADWDFKAQQPLTAVSAIEVNVHPNARGRQLSGIMLQAMRENVQRLGFQDLYAPVRPTHKHLEPHTPMSEYAFRTREDGLPFDPWLRVHVRAGASLIKVAPTSMTVSGSLEQWREWTGMPFDQDGEVTVPGGLVPVQVSQAHGYAVYVEPNVWLHHRLSPSVN